MTSELSQSLLLQHGSAEVIAERAVVPLCDFGSGLRYGIVVQADGAGEHGRWAVSDGGKLTLFGAGNERAFVEFLEHPRAEVEAKIEVRARALGLPPLETAWSLPAIDLLRAMLAGSSQHFARLALAWVLPSELRDLRPELQAVANNTAFPNAVRSLAERLVVNHAS